TEYRSRRNAAITNKKLFETIYNCEFLGFIDSNHRRVGCMLHPAVTGNQALRNNCFYGSKICNEHFCPSFGCLTTVEQRAVVESLDDWYLYGLVITDIDLVKEFFRHVENALGEGIKEKRLGNPKIRGLFREYFSLKETWPYKASKNRLGKYYFSKAEYAIARIEYEKKWGLPVSRYDKILVSLESDFKGPEQLKQAEEILDSIIRRFIEFYAAL
ncbi:MAG: hypothetical protein GY850_45950, partial [bacterium]|nr:hypothetical protein [bacterium]